MQNKRNILNPKLIFNLKLKNFIIFLAFSLLIYSGCNADKYDNSNSAYIKTNEGFKKLVLNVDSEGNIKSAKITDLYYSFFYEASVTMTEFQKIPNFEEVELNQILGIPLPDMGKKLFKISEENFFEIGEKRKILFVQGMFTLSSISDKENTFNYLESYGIGIRKKVFMWLSEEKYFKIFWGGYIKKINNFITFEKGMETQKDTEITTFFSILPKTENFFDFKVGSKIDDQNSIAFTSLYSKMKLEQFSDELSLIISGEISIRLKSFREGIYKEDFKRYGSYSISVGMDKQISENAKGQFLFLYEENRKMGYKKEGIAFKIYFLF